MYRGFLQLGQVELANSNRTVRYMMNGVRNLSTEVVTDDSWSMMPWFLGREREWLTPAEDDDCPWIDPSESASLEFAGVWPMRVDGLDSTPLDREVVESATDGGGFGNVRTPTRTISVEALLIGSTPAGLQYGLGWLNSVLRGDVSGGVPGEPRDLLFLASAPPVDPEMTVDQVALLGNAESRMVSSVVLTSPMEVDETLSPWVHEGRGATVARVTFELTAGVPWVWRMPQVLASGLRPFAGVEDSVVFDNTPRSAGNGSDVLNDPSSPPLTALPRPVTPAAALGLYPLESKRLMWRLEAGVLSPWFEALPTITVETGARAERALRFQWVRGVPAPGSDISEESIGEALVRYLPPRSTLTLDAVTGRSQVVTESGEVLNATPVTTGRHGGPWRAPVLSGRESYTLVIDAERSVSADVTVQVDAMVRRP